jgi:hypothetical protein
MVTVITVIVTSGQLNKETDMADPTLTDVLIAVDAARAEMRNSFVAAREDREKLRRDMEANTASILGDLSKQVARVVREIDQLREGAFVDGARVTRLERMATRVGAGDRRPTAADQQTDRARGQSGTGRGLNDP